jgi:hypothetical protein
MMCVQAASAQLFYDFSLDDHPPSDHLLRRLPPTIRLIGSIVRLACLRRSGRSRQFLHSGADRPERTKFVLLYAETVGVGAIWSVVRLLESCRKILIEVRLFWPLLADDLARDIIGAPVREHGGVVRGADWHVAHGVCGSG